jgi:hypothetical protein
MRIDNIIRPGLPDDIKRYVEYKDRQHKDEIDVLKARITESERWLELSMPGAREPEDPRRYALTEQQSH